ncbi:hypothetical protein RhiirA5_432649 [Rhizophagus irregularis]|uniref:Uncharacterized protein n=1 Tax=Rhizophagus irregularis TaxID=588596 RepID=A0A2N0NSY5_9GLOM|nr:hypothetical protein RhiirA5_432649 [Rhizophagus irregularis]
MQRLRIFDHIKNVQYHENCPINVKALFLERCLLVQIIVPQSISKTGTMHEDHKNIFA